MLYSDCVYKPVRPGLLVERPYYVQQLVDYDEVDAAGGAKVDGQVPAGPKREMNEADFLSRCIFLWTSNCLRSPCHLYT